MKLSGTKVEQDAVGYEMTSGDPNNGTRVSGSAGGEGHGCVAVLTQGGSRSVCGPTETTPPEAQEGAAVTQFVLAAEGTARIHLVSD